MKYKYFIRASKRTIIDFLFAIYHSYSMRIKYWQTRAFRYCVNCEYENRERNNNIQLQRNQIPYSVARIMPINFVRFPFHVSHRFIFSFSSEIFPFSQCAIPLANVWLTCNNVGMLISNLAAFFILHDNATWFSLTQRESKKESKKWMAENQECWESKHKVLVRKIYLDKFSQWPLSFSAVHMKKKN